MVSLDHVTGLSFSVRVAGDRRASERAMERHPQGQQLATAGDESALEVLQPHDRGEDRQVVREALAVADLRFVEQLPSDRQLIVQQFNTFRAFSFLEKPITLQKLLKAVEQGLARNAAHPTAPAAAAPAPAHAPVDTTFAQAPAVATVAVTADAGPHAHQGFDLDRPLREARDGFEKAYFEFHLAREGGSMTRVAEKTGLERTHLYRKLRQLGVDLGRGKRG